MEIAIAIGACASVPFIYSALRPKFKTTVNCWFCNTDSKVDYVNRNSFVCVNCEQYNGFNEDGDYNRHLPQQTFSSSSIRYCKPGKMTNTAKHPDLIPERFGNLNMSPKNANGLCSACNRNQEIIMNKVREFEPINEDRWNEELEDYRYKLERMYQLCARCTIAVHGKLEEDKKKYSYLLEIRHKLKRAIGSTINRFINPNSKRSRRFFFAGGKVCELSRVFTFFISLCYFLANIEFLQEDADVYLLRFPKYLSSYLNLIHSQSIVIHTTIIFFHIIACFNNKCRTTLPDLLLPLIILISFGTVFAENETFSEDLALVRCACSSFVTILAIAASLIPRKKLHKKRPNKIISSAFSVASTPTSQCSSQASRNVSLIDKNNSRFNESPFKKNNSPSPRQKAFNSNSNNTSESPLTKLRWRERAQSPEIEQLKKVPKEQNEEMDWDDSESVAQSTRSKFAPSILSQLRETTPSRELAPSVASMSLFSKKLDEESNSTFMRTARPLTATNSPAHSVFSRQNRMLNSPSRSICSPRSIAATHFEKPFISDSHTRTGSVFTSISQQDRNSSIGGEWQCRVFVILFSLIFIILVFQVVLCYILLKK